MIVYGDASGLVKLVIDEDGSQIAADVWDAADLVVSSPLAHVEVRAALAAAARAGRLSAHDHLVAVGSWDTLRLALATVALTGSVADHAGELAEAQALRGADAVHLASALTVPGIHMLVWDTRLRAGAVAAGMGVIPA